jgi:hypothetical protein
MPDWSLQQLTALGGRRPAAIGLDDAESVISRYAEEMARPRLIRAVASGMPALAAFAALSLPPTAAAQTDGVPATPVDPVTAIVNAFGDHDIVALGDAHGNVQSQNFLKVLIRDPRFAAVANDIVVEFGNARYQDVIDRFVRGEAVDERSLRSVWQNTTVANEIPVDQAFFETVRAVNATLPPDRRLRVLLSDPPIDWATVKTRQDHFAWLAMRDTYPAALVQIEVLAKRRRALLVYGQLHFQRRNIMSNLEMDDWRAQTIVSLIERAAADWRACSRSGNLTTGSPRHRATCRRGRRHPSRRCGARASAPRTSRC